MKVKKLAAGAIVGAVLPIMTDVATEPYADRGPLQSWLWGAGKLAALGVIGWAFRTVGDEEKVPVPA